jgi:hypothetical protein
MSNRTERLITLPKRQPFKNIYQFKITLLETNPPVWRRIQVPESYTFYDFHVAIQDAMGWLDCHLHMFDMKNKNKKNGLIRIDCPFGDPEFDKEDYFLTTEVPISTFFNTEKETALYTYDFGDNWEHEVLLEKILPRGTKIKYPVCLDGELACPPEDCGSIPGYYRCIEALKTRDDEDLLDWLGDWRPDRFNPKDIIFESPRNRLKMALEID